MVVHFVRFVAVPFDNAFCTVDDAAVSLDICIISVGSIDSGSKHLAAGFCHSTAIFMLVVIVKKIDISFKITFLDFVLGDQIWSLARVHRPCHKREQSHSRLAARLSRRDREAKLG